MGESRHPDKSKEQIRESRIGFITILSIMIGFAAGGIAFVLYHLIGLFTNIFYYQKISFTFVSPTGSTLGPIMIILPVIGGLAAGLMIKYGSPKIIGHGIPETMESVLLNSSVVHPKIGFLKAISASFTIGSGQPFGAEGPIIQTGGAIGSFIGQMVAITGSERKILLASGAAAGMAATFGTPISAVLLVVELLLFEFRVKSLVPIGIAAAIGGLMHLLLISPEPLFETPQFVLPLNVDSVWSLLFFAVLGIICGVVGSGLSRALYKSEDMFHRLPLGQPWLPMIGGLGVGLIGFVVPQILGVGYGTISDILNGRTLIELAIVIMVAKSAAWIFAMGSQTSGGTLAPLFMIGSALGYVYGSALSSILSSFGLVPGIFAVAGLAAVFGTASRAPVAAFVFALEVTQDFQIAIPIMVTMLSAELIGEYLMQETIMTERLARRDLRVRNLYEYNPLRQIRVSKVMSSPLTTVCETEKVLDVYKEVNHPGHEYSKRKRLVAVSTEGRVVGILDRETLFAEVTRMETAGVDKDEKIDKIISDTFSTIKEGEMAYEALVLMSLEGRTYLIVVNDQNKAVGYVSRGDLLRAQKRKIFDETIIQKAQYSLWKRWPNQAENCSR